MKKNKNFLYQVCFSKNAIWLPEVVFGLFRELAWFYEISWGWWTVTRTTCSGDRASSRDTPNGWSTSRRPASPLLYVWWERVGNWEQERQAEARGLPAPWSAAPAEHWPPARPRHGDQEDTVPGEVLRPHGGPGHPPDRGQQLRQPRRRRSSGSFRPSQVWVKKTIICNHLVPVKVM